MLFCEPSYFLLLLPISVVLYWWTINKRRPSWGVFVLILTSVVFYCSWNWKFFLLLFVSASFNFLIGQKLLQQDHNKPYLYLGLLFNLGLLGYFKYFNFFIDNCNALLGTHWQVAKVILPLGISFYTFQQIAYIVDAYRRQLQPCTFRNYVLFVIYFPQLVAGPIVHYQEMMPQFERRGGIRRSVHWESIWNGLWVFIFGLFKKVVIADSLAGFVQTGYAHVDQLGIVGAWMLSLAYTFQLYFDFSGYADMAIGSGLCFGIRLPENFNSPYKALDIQDFWRRWHMTLSTWLKNYIYFPLGGSRCTLLRTCVNLFLTFFIGGIWHGAGWTFIIWGTLHGLAAVVHRLWLETGLHLHKILAWFITFNFINIAWIFFRADSAHDAYIVLKKMCDLSFLGKIYGAMTLTDVYEVVVGSKISFCRWLFFRTFLWIGIGSILCCVFRNTRQVFERWGEPSWIKTFLLNVLFWTILYLCFGNAKIEFLYWQF